MASKSKVAGGLLVGMGQGMQQIAQRKIDKEEKLADELRAKRLAEYRQKLDDTSWEKREGVRMKNEEGLLEKRHQNALEKQEIADLNASDNADLKYKRDLEIAKIKATGAANKDKRFTLKTGAKVTLDDLRQSYAEEFSRDDGLGNVSLDQNAPGFVEWANSQAASPIFATEGSAPSAPSLDGAHRLDAGQTYSELDSMPAEDIVKKIEASPESAAAIKGALPTKKKKEIAEYLKTRGTEGLLEDTPAPKPTEKQKAPAVPQPKGTVQHVSIPDQISGLLDDAKSAGYGWSAGEEQALSNKHVQHTVEVLKTGLINGKPISQAMRKKYLDQYKRLTGKAYQEG